MKLALFLLLQVFICAFSLNVQAQQKENLTFIIHLNQPVQIIRNIGASGCWYSEEIGATWPDDKKERVAELLFSKSFDEKGRPRGIGLSAFRYNIGAGTTEQGDSSGIPDPSHRVECFLSPDGSYNWNKQTGYTWMLQEAKNYGVKELIAFVNSPPVQFTQNGKGFKFKKDSLSNLKEDKYEAFADFLAEVLTHFDKKNLHFNYVSPVNEPQWDWTGTMGNAKQEGTPWTNQEIYRITKALNNSFSNQKLKTKILLTEAAKLDFLYSSNLPSRSKQIANFWDSKSSLYVGGLSNTTPFVEGHGYFTDEGDASMIKIRRSLKDSLKNYPNLEFWQSEYSMLGNGYRDGKAGRLNPMDYALFLAKIIHHDFVIGNATAWHYWNAYEPGSANNPRYYLIAMNPNRTTNPDTLFTVTKNLWALGHYSLFVRPGMMRIETGRTDGLADTAIAKNIMISAFRDIKGKKLVVNMINYTNEDKIANLRLEGITKNKKLRLTKQYVTSANEGDNMKPYPLNSKNEKRSIYSSSNNVTLPARSITSFLFEK
jgi:O-glycosyl hydrolase